MNLSRTALILWAASFLANAALFIVLLFRRRIDVVPWFSAWIGFNLLYTTVLYGTYKLGTRETYIVLYWTGAFLDLALQVGMVMEIAGYVFRRGGQWVERARERLLVAGLASAFAGILMGWAMTPAAVSRLEGVESRIDLGATVFITILFTSVMVVSHQLGLSWKNLVLREGYGVAAWSVFSFITDTLHAYWRTAEHFTLLEHVRIIVYLAALGYWIAIFWRLESTLDMPEVTRTGIESMLQRLE
ncbi:MAG: hypothetical protein ACRYFU_25630 [Janthinobacterium lividum]